MGTKNKIKTLGTIVKIVKAAQRTGKKVVTTNGCYDLLHPGHLETLEWASQQGDVLVVGIDSDASVRKNKGPNRPIISSEDRARLLAGLTAVDYVFVFHTPNPIPWLKKLKPEIHVKGRGSELDPRLAPEKKAVEDGGGKIVLAPKVGRLSTTGIVETILDRYGKRKR